MPEQEASTTTLSPSEQRESIVMNQEDSTVAESESSKLFKPFFEKEVSEAELMGEESEEEVKETKEVKEEAKKEAKEVPKEDVKEEVKEGTKPPAGFVPKGALNEEREKRKQLQAELETLRQQLAKPPAEVVVDDQGRGLLKSIGLPEDFTVLTEAEEDVLMEEDIYSYQKYQRNLRKYERATNEVTAKQRIEQEIASKAATVVEGAVRRMESAVPGIHEANSEINKKLTEFAVTHGFESDYLNALTDPKTMFLPAGAKEPMYLGDGAAALVEFINNTFKSQDQAQIVSKLEKEITERVTQELIQKFKTPGKTNFKSLGDAPGSMDAVKTGSLTERDFAKMSEEEQRVALGG